MWVAMSDFKLAVDENIRTQGVSVLNLEAMAVIVSEIWSIGILQPSGL